MSSTQWLNIQRPLSFRDGRHFYYFFYFVTMFLHTLSMRCHRVSQDYPNQTLKSKISQQITPNCNISNLKQVS